MSVLGTWKLTITTPMGTQNPIIAFIDEGGTVKGIMTAPTGESGEAGTVVVDGDSVTWKADVNGPMGAMNLAFSATATGDTLTGQVTTPMGAMPITGARQP
jgi:hypothetical protein